MCLPPILGPHHLSWQLQCLHGWPAKCPGSSLPRVPMAKEWPLLPLQYCHPLPFCIHRTKTCITFKILHTVTPTHLLWHFHHISHLSRHKIGDFSISICLFLCSHFSSSLGSMAHHCNDLASLSLSTTLVWTWMPTAPSLHPNVELCQICTTGQIGFTIRDPTAQMTPLYNVPPQCFYFFIFLKFFIYLW